MSTFYCGVVVTAIATVSAGVYKLTYDCSDLPYPFLTPAPVFKVIHGADTHLYSITAIGDCDFTITISGVDYVPVLTDTFRLPLPTFVHGTQKKAKPEIDQIALNNNLVYPLVYLQEIQTENISNDPLSRIYSKTPVRIWFLLANGDQWTTEDHYEYAINSMKALAERFMFRLHYEGVTADPDNDRDEANLVYHANIGSTSETGHLKDLLNQPHSGTLLLSTLSLSKQVCCC